MNQADLIHSVDNYQPSDDVLRAMGRIKLLGTVGPTASGKTTLMNRLVAIDPGFQMVVDETTRQPRPGEVAGVDFIFHDRDKVIEDMQSKKLVQAAIGPNGDLYCTRPNSYPDDGIGLLAMVPAAVREFRRLPIQKFETAFIVPATYDLWQSWLTRQAQNGNWSEEQLTGRKLEAKSSYEFALQDDKIRFILNDDISKAADRLRQVGTGQTPDDEEQAKEVAKQNLAKLSSELENAQ